MIPAEAAREGTEVSLTENVDVYFEDYILQFTGYEMNNHGVGEGEIFVQALIKGKGPGGKFTLNPAIRVVNEEKSFVPDNLADTDRGVNIEGINLEEKTITLMIANRDDETDKSEGQKEMLAIEITEKPLINLLWLGTILMISGLVVAITNRIKYKPF